MFRSWELSVIQMRVSEVNDRCNKKMWGSQRHRSERWLCVLPGWIFREVPMKFEMKPATDTYCSCMIPTVVVLFSPSTHFFQGCNCTQLNPIERSPPQWLSVPQFTNLLASEKHLRSGHWSANWRRSVRKKSLNQLPSSPLEARLAASRSGGRTSGKVNDLRLRWKGNKLTVFKGKLSMCSSYHVLSLLVGLLDGLFLLMMRACSAIK